jgi:hypothetical protein
MGSTGARATSGSLEANGVAPFFALLGVSDFALSLGLVPWSIFFACVLFCTARRMGGDREASKDGATGRPRPRRAGASLPTSTAVLWSRPGGERAVRALRAARGPLAPPHAARDFREFNWSIGELAVFGMGANDVLFQVREFADPTSPAVMERRLRLQSIREPENDAPLVELRHLYRSLGDWEKLREVERT